MKILVVEDEANIRKLLTLNLSQQGYSVLEACDGLEALMVLKKETVDLAVLDVMMPRLDGFNLLRKIRETSTLPVIFLTARESDMDKVLGLGLGADDYLVKPFSMAELIARVGAHLRRNRAYAARGPEPEAGLEIACGGLVLNRDRCSVTRDGVPIELNAKEFRLLSYLMENQARVFTKKQIYKAVWEEEAYYDDNTVMVHVSHLRTKIEADPRNPVYIRTIRGIGYKLQKDDDVGGRGSGGLGDRERGDPGGCAEPCAADAGSAGGEP